MKKFRIIFLCLFSIASLVFFGCRRDDGTILITLAHGAPVEHSAHIGFLKFQELVEAGSDGAIRVQIFPNNQLGGDREILEGTQFGNITGGFSSQSPIAAFASEFFILDTPFLFASRDEAFEVLDGEPGQRLMSYLERINIKGLGFAENGFRHLTGNRVVRSPDDLRGVRIRVMENEVQILTWSSLNANPTPMAFGELFTALQQGVVDSQENPIEFIYSMKFYEVQNYLMLTQHIYSPLLFFLNLEFYNNLSPEHRELVNNAAREAILHNRRVAAENELRAKEILRNHMTIVELSESELQAFRALMPPVHSIIRQRMNNDELFNLFL